MNEADRKKRNADRLKELYPTFRTRLKNVISHLKRLGCVLAYKMRGVRLLIKRRLTTAGTQNFSMGFITSRVPLAPPSRSRLISSTMILR